MIENMKNVFCVHRIVKKYFMGMKLKIKHYVILDSFKINIRKHHDYNKRYVEYKVEDEKDERRTRKKDKCNANYNGRCC